MQCVESSGFDPTKPTIGLYFQVAVGNRLFGHTLCEVYLTQLYEMAKEQGFNLAYISFTAKDPSYFKKVSHLADSVITVDPDEIKNAPFTFNERFQSMDIEPIRRLNLARLISLTTPIVINKTSTRRTLDRHLNSKQSTMMSINLARVQYFGGAWLANTLEMNLDHIVVDPLESDYTKLPGFERCGTRWFLYDSERFKATALHLTERYYKQHQPRPMIELAGDLIAPLDVLIGYSITQESRKWMQRYDFDAAMVNSGLSYRVCLKDNYRNIDTFVWDKAEYLELLRHSKYTVVFPSYEPKAFSTIRFIEALSCGAIPLLLDACYLDEAFTQNELSMVRPLVVNDSTIVNVIRSLDHTTVLTQLRGWFLRDKMLSLSLSSS